MMQVTIFGGHDGILQLDKWFYLTLFGGCELRRPTLARQLLGRRRSEQTGELIRRKPFFLTLFGGAEIKSPTLAAEFIDLRELIHSGVLPLSDWDRALAELGRIEESVASFTMFGGFDERSLPTEEEEIDGLAIQCHLGNIDESTRVVLQSGIGQRDPERRAVVRRAVQAGV